MKKLFTIIVIAALSVSTMSAQKCYTSKQGYTFPANEFSISYGRMSIPDIGLTLGGLFGTMFTLGYAVPSHIISVGAVSTEYMRYVHPNVALGGSITYEAYNLSFGVKDGTDEEGHNTYSKGDPHFFHFVSIMPTFKFPWFNFSHVGMYSKIAGGICLSFEPASLSSSEETEEDSSDKNSPVGWALQLTPVGVEFGGDTARGFVETGVGMQGMLIVGARFRF